ncbi:MAG TPA: NAD(P)/FAD-dependent oxidoreductase [Bacteroidales bacterium]|nr:NAD(P)/FAD-dependent oxidoreductase [Bacteroidales bacterium]
MDTTLTIIGGGVIGLAIAEELSLHFPELFLLERHSSFGQETSSRNSEVIHAGIYYPEGSLKARFCVEGNILLYEYCRKFDIPHSKCGKLIIASTQGEVAILENIKRSALKNGVNLEVIERERLSIMEPEVSAIKALLSPTTGIVDSHSLMKRFETNTINNGGNVVYKCEVIAVKKINDGYEVHVKNADNTTFSFTTNFLINCAGLEADKISEMVGIKDEKLRIVFCKGDYYKVRSTINKKIKRLIYPVPHPNMEGIGVHLTIDMAGGVRLGPDVEYLKTNIYDYRLSGNKKEAFFQSAKKFLPSLRFDDISPDMAGIRPKIQKPGEPQKDFYIKEESSRGLKGFINLVGMESPGLTSCIAIAKYVKSLIGNNA